MILGSKVRLRAIERADLPTFVRWFNDPQVREYLALYMPMSLAEEERWFERHLEDKDNMIFAVETLDGTHIGNVGLHRFEWKDRGVELGIVLGEKAYWNKGYGTDAIRTLLGFAFRELNLNRVFLRVRADNARAIRCYSKCGFQHEGTLREAVFQDGRYYDHWIMSILAREYKQAHG